MPDERERRLALNEAAFRVANERMTAWPERRAAAGHSRYYCECANPACREQVLLDLAEYEQVRSSSDQFVMVPGHEVPDVERVIERHERYQVAKKNPSVRSLVEGTDPRTPD